MIFNPIIYGAKTSNLMYIYVDHLPDKTSYYTGENFDPTGMVVKGVTVDLVEVIIPNDQLSYVPPMPLRVGSELLRLLYTEPESGRTYGTTLSITILIGIWAIDEIPILPIPKADELDTVSEAISTSLISVLRVDVADTLGKPVIPKSESVIGFVESLEPKAPIVRAIVHLSHTLYTTEVNDRIMLQPDYHYDCEDSTIDSGMLCVLNISTSDKYSVDSIDVSLVR